MVAVRLVAVLACSVFGLLISGCGGSHGLKYLGDGICLNTGTGLMWQVERTDKLPDWEMAKEYADRLELGGYPDWRLPSKSELYILHVLFDLKKQGDCPLVPKGSYWLENRLAEARVGYWETYPLCGGTEYQYRKATSGYVRAVRP